MSKILVLADTGFGKSTSIGAVPELEIKGLPVEETYLITVTSKPMPFRGSAKLYPIIEPGAKLSTGRRVVSNNAKEIADYLTTLATVPGINNVILDDANYIMQDYFMDNSLKKGWDTPKQIGFDMNLIFKAMELYKNPGRNVFMLAHGEYVDMKDGRQFMQMKTTGKAVNEYITPAGKFEIVLFGVSKWDSNKKKSIREYLTNEDEFYKGAKSPIGMFDELYIPNDLGYVADKIHSYYFD